MLVDALARLEDPPSPTARLGPIHGRATARAAMSTHTLSRCFATPPTLASISQNQTCTSSAAQVYNNFVVTPKDNIISKQALQPPTQKYEDSDSEESDPGWAEREVKRRRGYNTPSPINSPHGSVWDLVVDDEEES